MANINKKCGRHKTSDSMKDGILPLFSIDDSSISVPAAGNRNGTSLNNEGSYGNYWSSTPNESNAQNAYNLNFNDGNHNVDWNYRKNGHSVRPVAELTSKQKQSDCHRSFLITKEILLLDLYTAYKDARRHKRWKSYQLNFEFNLEENLINLRDDLLDRKYVIGKSDCFVIHDPKMREVFAARFRDRIVHHLLYNYTHTLYERKFIYDSYSCISGKGTHFGIERLLHHIKCVSNGYSKPCYILKFDIQAYFMSIDRRILLSLCKKHLNKIKYLKSDDPAIIKLIENIDFINYLIDTIVLDDPSKNCVRIGERAEWNRLPPKKSLFNSASGCGLPIGNLSSQLFSNIYLNELDQYIKRTLHCKNYGRYVDDGYIVSDNKNKLKYYIPKISHFLSSNLNLNLNLDKTFILNAYHGVSFLGSYLLPFRRYVDNKTLKRMSRKVKEMSPKNPRELMSVINSILGVFSHCNSYCIRKVMLGSDSRLIRHGRFSNDMLKYYPHAIEIKL